MQDKIHERYNQTTHFIIESVMRFKWWFLPQIVVATLWAIDVSLRPYILKVMMDRLQGLNPADAVSELSGPALIYILLTLVIVVMFRCYDYARLMLNAALKRYVGDKLMSRMMQHSHSLFQNHFAGSLGNKIKDVMSSVPDLLGLLTDSFMAHFLALVIAIFTFATVKHQFAVILAIWVTIYLIGSITLSKKASCLSHIASEVRSTVVGRIVDILGNMTSVRLFSARKFESKQFTRDLDKYAAADKTRDKYFMWMYSFQGFSFAVYEAICIIYLILGFKNGEISIGDFVMILTINSSLIDSLWNLSEDIGKFAEYYGNIEQGLAIALSDIEIKDGSFPPSVVQEEASGDNTHHIEFKNVRFHYKDTKALFENKSVVIKKGQKVGLVGYSGSGKTTFVNLILRLYDITDGSILMNGVDIRSIPQDTLRTMIGMIPQDPSLFHRALIENIRYSMEGASEAEVHEAAKRAHAHEFIMRLPEGYNTMVGERGVKLSGGQRQRIAIARAILKNAPILILDEATSQLDSVTEHDIQESLWELMQDKTAIVIAHRLSTLLQMDRIIVFDQGNIVEDGAHKELLDKNGLYRTLWEAQIGGFLPEQRK
ncbi:MAG: ABC transporter ATP-binding protein [Pseudomonadota bacterium]